MIKQAAYQETAERQMLVQRITIIIKVIELQSISATLFKAMQGSDAGAPPKKGPAVSCRAWKPRLCLSGG
jgi:hypothetical protein